MAKSCRVTITRPTLDVVLPHEVFGEVRDASARYHVDLEVDVQTYIQGHLTTTTVVDHLVADDAEYDANKADIMSVVPWWQDESNSADVETYQTDNGIIVTIEDVVDPDISDAINVTRVFEM